MIVENNKLSNEKKKEFAKQLLELINEDLSDEK